MLKIKRCPTCGSGKLKKQCRDWTGQFRGQTYTVPELCFYECPNCSERVYDRDAMKRIEEHSPAFQGAEVRR